MSLTKIEKQSLISNNVQIILNITWLVLLYIKVQQSRVIITVS
jgi:hypothetical protein